MSHEFPKVPRVVVTGYENGKSTIIQNSLSDNISEHIPGLVIADIWSTDTMPVDLTKTTKIENTALPAVPKNGSYFRYVTIPPDTAIMKHLNISYDQHSHNSKHPLMHKTETLDYIIILSGEVYLILEEQETLLKAGDIVIQRATEHAWSNRTKNPCIQLSILLDARNIPD
jgi:quercetin dioxygenase-like cupin family protein